MLHVTSLRDAETGQINTKIVRWNVSFVASATILSVLVYYLERLFLSFFISV